MKLTKTTVEKLPVPPLKNGKPAQVFHRDDDLTCFAVRVTSNGVKSFVVEKRVNGVVRRITLGRYGDELTVEQARRKAQQEIGKFVSGIDPVSERKKVKVQGVTFEEVFTEYVKIKKPKASTAKDYRKLIEQNLKDWKPRALASITEDDIQTRHALIGARSAARANYSMRVVRAMFNFAKWRYKDENKKTLFPDNPVKQLSNMKAWYRVDRKKTYVKPHQMPAWWEAVVNLKGDSEPNRANDVRDWLLTLVLTGLRHDEGLSLLKSQIDLKDRTLTVPDTKNHEPHVLPLSDFLYDLLAPRVKSGTGPFVFGNADDPKDGAISKAARYRMMRKIVKASGVKFSPHPLRRTFTTIAEGLDISAYAVKRLLNHKMKDDVTAGYIMRDVERLRKPMQKITDEILRLAGARKKGTVVELRAAS